MRTSADLDGFLDCLSLHPGDEWKARLAEEIERRGIDNIEPHLLEAVPDGPPPPELASLHFGDPRIVSREAYERKPPNA